MKQIENYFAMAVLSYLKLKQNKDITGDQLRGLYKHLTCLGYSIERKKKSKYTYIIDFTIIVLKTLVGILFFKHQKLHLPYSNTAAINTKKITKFRNFRGFKACFRFSNPMIMLNRNLKHWFID